MGEIIDLKKVLAKLTPVNQKELTFEETNLRMDALQIEARLNMDLSKMYLARSEAADKEFAKLAQEMLESAIEEL